MEDSKQNPHLTPLPQGEANKKIRRARFSPLPLGEEAAERQVRVLSAFIWLVLAIAFFGCETSNYAPGVNQEMVVASRRRNLDPSTSLRTSLAALDRGRTLFVHRCIECHTLPAIWKYSREDWPKIVNDMSHRASLKPEDREVIVAYILAVRASER